MKKLALITALALIATVCNAAKWECEKLVDPITDQTSCVFWTHGTEISSPDGQFCPKLAVRIVSNGDVDVFLFSPAIKRKQEQASVEVTARFDSDAPVASAWCGSDNKCALFCEDPDRLFSRLKSSSKLSLRFKHGGLERTTTFDTSNFPKMPTVAKAAKSAAVQSKTQLCRKCKGAGTITEWKTCIECGGTGMSSGSRCRKCVRSAKTGKLREKIPCPDCSSPAGKTAYAPHGYHRAVRSHVRNEIAASIAAENDAMISGYYDEVKNWPKSKRMSNVQK